MRECAGPLCWIAYVGWWSSLLFQVPVERLCSLDKILRRDYLTPCF